MVSCVLGGTFNILHKGHEALFRRALLFDKIFIGITSDGFVRKNKIYPPTPFSKRKKEVERWFAKRNRKIKTIKIEDVFGDTLEKEYDYIVVSEETLPNAEKINRMRKKLGKRQMGIVVVPLVLAYDGKKISALRIYKGEIDRSGRKAQKKQKRWL
ncbi:MAG: pantetheine-phosphate adenylyltransferase [Candidatus Anstonellales archaeon]